MGLILWIAVTGLLIIVSLSIHAHSRTKQLLDRALNLQTECINLLHLTGVEFNEEIKRISADKELVQQWSVEMILFHNVSIIAMSLTVAFIVSNVFYPGMYVDQSFVTYILGGAAALANATALILPRISYQRLTKATGMVEGLVVVAYAAKELIIERRKGDRAVSEEE